MTDEQTGVEETKRGRVRRLFCDPMDELGFRRPRRMDDETFRAKQTRMVDALTYMSDDGLRTLFDFMKSKGQGKQRDQWPPRAMIYAYAELIEPCPIEKIPSMLSWFRSSAGARAAEDDTLVETFEFIQKYKKPPTMDGAQAAIRRQAEERRRNISMARSRVDRGVAMPDDEQLLAWHADRIAVVKSIMKPADAEERR
ncbi:hypothetical protein [Psychromarinibacter halotolerans]|uniref:Uncharacterized protein n=1 Tax=Psychromarinibacter halotolerans TaxID=1775175 RepID=A0ABV7H0S7_9RHOB|nr:hypothetical protein [Psychromarinibacter halotolerans]MDF0598975.1 hypothetical protein [Psychromarinibacter halotolerans]